MRNNLPLPDVGGRSHVGPHPEMREAASLTRCVEGPTIRFSLSRPILLQVAVEDGLYAVTEPTLAWSSYGETEREALISFAQDFEAQWQFIAQQPDEALAADALTLKRALRTLVDQAVLRA